MSPWSARKELLLWLKSPLIPVALQLYNSIVKLVLCYGCQIWITKEEIERIEMQYLKFILYLPKNASNIAVCGELGKFP